MAVSRRELMAMAATSLAFGGLSRAFAQAAPVEPTANEVEGYGALVPDPKGLFDLPRGFTYDIVSRAGQVMDDGFLTPGKLDGMACFPGSGDEVILVRNHELKPADVAISPFGVDGALAARLPAGSFYDRARGGGAPLPGGTSTLVWDVKRRKLVTHHLSLAGTTTNCAGGKTPYGAWLSCEESEQPAGLDGEKSHGWVFEVPAGLRGLADPHPITGMGRFKHEATATDPRTGIVYLTEDVTDGTCLFYRYLPNDAARLLAGGRLQALGFSREVVADSRNWDSRSWGPGDWRQTVWIDLDGVDSVGADLRHRGHAKGAALFARGEGIFFGQGELFFTCTSGGPTKQGQLLRYVLSPHEGQTGEADQPGRLQLFAEPTDPATMVMCDNITIAPNGHIFVCEDKSRGANKLCAVTPQGKIYTVGRNPAAPLTASSPVNTELAGVCFSPDGSTCFVNIYQPGTTIAITGPWGRVKT